MSEPIMTIQIDTREEKPLRFDNFGVQVETVTLPVGDYGVRGFSGEKPEDLTLFGVERKGTDLAASLGVDKVRFYKMIRRTRAYSFFGMVLECTEEDILTHNYWSRMNPEAIIKRLESLEVNYSIHVAFCGDAEGAAEKVHTWALRFWHRQMEQHKRLTKIIGGA